MMIVVMHECAITTALYIHTKINLHEKSGISYNKGYADGFVSIYPQSG
jgi:hypothetical protein